MDGKSPASPPNEQAMHARRLASNAWLDVNDLTGLLVDDARRRAEQAGFPFHYVALDPGPIPMVLTADFRPGRITATTRGGVVIKAEAGN